MIDILQMFYGNGSPEKKVLNYGHVRLVDCMPRLVPEDQTCDQAIVQAARVSYGEGTKTVSEDKGLIRYLMRHQHTTPFEMVEFKWHAKMPIFVCRQWIRHRMVSANEISGRYSAMKDEFYFPELSNIRLQSTTNKQGSENLVNDIDANTFLEILDELCEKAYISYETALAKGISREQARMLLPLNLYTELYWKIDLKNFLHFLALRCDKHAQQEIRVYADAMLELITPLVPLTIEAWNDFDSYRGAVTFSRLEYERLKDTINGIRSNEFGVLDGVNASQYTLNSGNKREDAEWMEKLKNLGI